MSGTMLFFEFTHFSNNIHINYNDRTFTLNNIRNRNVALELETLTKNCNTIGLLPDNNNSILRTKCIIKYNPILLYKKEFLIEFQQQQKF